MRMTFERWPGRCRQPRARQFVESLRNAAESAALLELLPDSDDSLRRVHFLVIDVTKRTREPLKLEAALRALLMDTPDSGAAIEDLERRTGSPIRLLFIGETPGLDDREEEFDGCVSTKKALEFYIRTLQNAGLGHYGSAADPPRRTRFRAGADIWSEGWTKSAVIALARHYALDLGGTPIAAFGTLRKRLAGSIATAIAFARENDPHLLGPPSKVGDAELIEEMGAFFQLGKRSGVRAEGRLSEIFKRRDESGSRRDESGSRSSYALWTRLEEHLRKWKRLPPEADAADVAEDSAALMRYQLLRDLGRSIGSGALTYLQDYAARRPQPRLLIVDDSLVAGETYITQPLRGLLARTGWCDSTDVCASLPFRPRADSADLLSEDQVLAAGIDVEALSGGERQRRRLGEYALILADVEADGAPLGPSLVQRIKTLTERRGEGTEPPIIVLTRTESIGHIQQSLNLGAFSYVLKERLLQLPFQMRRALEAAEDYRNDTRETSDFRKLAALRPERRAALHRSSGLSFVRGGLLGRERLLIDAREEDWIWQLPKADLHCHFGTCISYPAIATMALNSVRYVLARERRQREAPTVATVISRVGAALAIAEWIQGRTGLHPILALAAGAGAVVDDVKTLPKDLPRFGLGDQIVAWLRKDSERVLPFELTSLLVASICVGEPRSVWRDHVRYFARVAALLRRRPKDEAESMRQGAVRGAAAAAARKLRRVAAGWQGNSTAAQVRSLFHEFKNEPGDWWRLHRAIGDHCEVAEQRLRAERAKCWNWLRGREDLPGLQRQQALERVAYLVGRWHLPDFVESGRAKSLDGLARGPSRREAAPRPVPLECYVRIPADGEPDPGGEKGLQRYLRGADLLGADHLQYPENLLIGAFAFVLDNALDNVIYSEVRCETTGYCHAGMDPYRATDVLCRGLDLASLVVSFGDPRALPLVRTNLLIAAKRHKKESAAREAVTLLTHYLHQRNDEERFRPYLGLPSWWGRCRPAGFDVSGDEGKDPEWLERIFEPLARLSSPITIHAGEAASAGSIWAAVYRNHATRIGHGLRLRENDALLRYCVDEGICMEMCPNSNVFTNRFEREDDRSYPNSDDTRAAYPLMAYMRKGLEVAISSDNRYLHPQQLRTLTSEYLAAARLSNGLTRWEILQLVKSGFKNAFLPKKEVQALVGAVEERVYRMVAGGWF